MSSRFPVPGAAASSLAIALALAGAVAGSPRAGTSYIGEIELERIEVHLEGLPREFDGFRIAHLSDLHQRRFGENQSGLMAVLTEADPDLILLTGDILDKHRRDIEPVAELLEGIGGDRPAFAVPGNHELQNPRLPWLENAYREAGVRLLRNESFRLVRGGETLLIGGVDDVDFFSSGTGEVRSLAAALALLNEGRREGEPLLLLSHRPERLADYVEAGADIVFSGHAHGGQIRLPLIRGLFAPDQGFFPRYTSGRYRSGGTTLLVSRGLANPVLIPRIGNPFHVPLVVLRSGSDPAVDSGSNRSGASR